MWLRICRGNDDSFFPAQHKLLLPPNKAVKVKVAVFRRNRRDHSRRLFLSDWLYCMTFFRKCQFLSRRKDRFMRFSQRNPKRYSNILGKMSKSFDAFDCFWTGPPSGGPVRAQRSMVETSMVISSSTSSSARTVSRAVKMVTPFSTAHWRIWWPSVREPGSEPKSRVLMT